MGLRNTPLRNLEEQKLIKRRVKGFAGYKKVFLKQTRFYEVMKSDIHSE